MEKIKQENKEIIFLYNIKINKIKNILKKIENKKIINIDIGYRRIKNIDKVNRKYNVVLVNNKNKIKYIKKYMIKSNKIFIYIKPYLNNVKKIYFLVRVLENDYGINQKKIVLFIEKKGRKNGIYHLVIKGIFNRYKTRFIWKVKS